MIIKPLRRILGGATLASLLALASCSSDAATRAGEAPATGPLVVLFPNSHSAFDGENTYQVPAMVEGLTAGITWTASDPALVDLAPGANGTVLLTTKAAGMVEVIATAGKRTGKTKLTITPHTPEEFRVGYERYTNGATAGKTGAGQPCAVCHGEMGTVHSPQQTGGFTDEELRDIILLGDLPARTYEKYGKNDEWHQLHQWAADLTEVAGLVVYLRALPPRSQGSKIDFGRGSPEFPQK